LQLDIAAGSAYGKDAAGLLRPMISIATKSIALPDDATRNILLEYTTLNTEQGTVQVTQGNNVVLGTGTEFTKLFAANRLLIIGTKSYIVQNVTDDTHLILASNFPDSSATGQSFSVGGWFSQSPGSVELSKIYSYDGFSLVVTSNSPTANQLWIATVITAGGSISTITDKRNLNLLRLWRPEDALTIRTSHTYTIPGDIAVAVGDVDYIPPFYVSLVQGQSAKLAKVRFKIKSGTSATCKLTKNGSDITGFTGITVGTTVAELTPTAVALADNDELGLVVTAISGSPKNLSFTIFSDIFLE